MVYQITYRAIGALEESMTHKFTSDGRKVAVVGALNAKETIVQEIFVTDGTEFPAGEHFVVKTLLDAPAETFQSKQKRQVEEDVARLKREAESLRSGIRGFRFASAAAAAKVKWIQGINEPEVAAAFEHIKAVLCGEYTHIIFNDYDGPEIAEWNAELFSISEGYGENKRFDGIRMVSLFGNWNKRLELGWRVHSYSDGSGSGRTSFTPCKSLQEAVQKAGEMINAKDHINDKDVEFCFKHGIPVDEAKNAARLAAKTEGINRQIEDAKTRLSKLEADLQSVDAHKEAPCNETK